jgi:hypothetical protein
MTRPPMWRCTRSRRRKPTWESVSSWGQATTRSKSNGARMDTTCGVGSRSQMGEALGNGMSRSVRVCKDKGQRVIMIREWTYWSKRK